MEQALRSSPRLALVPKCATSGKTVMLSGLQVPYVSKSIGLEELFFSLSCDIRFT